MTFDIAPIIVARSPASKSGRSAPAALARSTTDSRTPPARPHSEATSTGPTGVRAIASFIERIARLDVEQPVHETGEPTPWVGVDEGGLGQLVDLGRPVGQDRVEQCPAIREVVVQRADADAGAPRDLVERYIHTALGEQLGGGRHQLLTVPQSIRPQCRHQAILAKLRADSTSGTKLSMTSTSARPVLLVLGVGPGLGMSVAHRFGKEGYAVALISRSADASRRLPPSRLPTPVLTPRRSPPMPPTRTACATPSRPSAPASAASTSATTAPRR